MHTYFHLLIEAIKVVRIGQKGNTIIHRNSYKHTDIYMIDQEIVTSKSKLRRKNSPLRNLCCTPETKMSIIPQFKKEKKRSPIENSVNLYEINVMNLQIHTHTHRHIQKYPLPQCALLSQTKGIKVITFNLFSSKVIHLRDEALVVFGL